MKSLILLTHLVFLLSCSQTQNQNVSEQLSLDTISPEASELLLSWVGTGEEFHWNTSAMDQTKTTQFSTYYPFLNDTFSFEGISLGQFFQAIGLPEIKEYALLIGGDGYSAPLSKEDLESWPIYLTHRRDGILYSELDAIDNRGPFAIVIDMDELDPVLQREVDYLMVWNLVRIEIQ